MGDMNVYSPDWNLHCNRHQNASPLEELIDIYELIVSNDTDQPTWLTSQEISIIYLAFIIKNLGRLIFWEIPEEYSLLLDHEMILLQ